MAHQHDIHSWRAWYADGTRYTSKEHDWRSLPDVGFQVLMCYYGKGRTIYTCKDVYGILDGRVVCYGRGDDGTGVRTDLKDQALADHPGTEDVWKLGISIDDDVFEAMRLEAMGESL